MRRALLAATLLLTCAAVDAQQIENLAWSCADSSRVGQPVGNSDGNCLNQRWDYGDAGHLVAACAVNCTAWSQAIWTLWTANPANVFSCPVAKTPGPWSGCPGERYLPRDQIARVAPPPPQFAPQFNSFEATPRTVAPGGEVLISWTTQDMAGCSGSWRGGAPPPLNGTDRVTLAATTRIEMSCVGLGGSSHIVAHLVKVEEPTPFVLTPIRCRPYDAGASALYRERSSDGRLVSTWGCDTAEGYQWVERGYDHTRLAERLSCLNPDLIAALTVSDIQQIDAACTDKEFTATEKVTADALTTRWKARFTVQGGSSVVRRPVFTRNADGTRGAQLRIGGVLQYVLVGVPCNGRARLLGITARYHLVSGQQSEQGQVLPTASYAQCVKRDPPAGGFLTQ